MDGGIAPNSYPKQSTALIQIRGYKKSDIIYELIKESCRELVSLEKIYLNNYCDFITLPEYAKKEVLFGSDAGILQEKYKQMLVGPGDIERGHKEDEFISKSELYKGVKCLIDAYDFLSKKERDIDDKEYDSKK